jgi:hypothetical protein
VGLTEPGQAHDLFELVCSSKFGRRRRQRAMDGAAGFVVKVMAQDRAPA